MRTTSRTVSQLSASWRDIHFVRVSVVGSRYDPTTRVFTIAACSSGRRRQAMPHSLSLGLTHPCLFVFIRG